MLTWSLDKKKSGVRIQSRRDCSVMSPLINTGFKQCGNKHGIQSLTYRINMKFISVAELKQNQQ